MAAYEVEYEEWDALVAELARQRGAGGGSRSPTLPATS